VAVSGSNLFVVTGLAAGKTTLTAHTDTSAALKFQAIRVK